MNKGEVNLTPMWHETPGTRGLSSLRGFTLNIGSVSIEISTEA
jgi:hypothetical protein